MFQILKQVFTLHTHAKRNNHNDDFPRVSFSNASSAQQSLKDFRMRFKKQDLVYADFTSFIDTATALLEPNLSERQLAMLNINPTLRNELTRARNWSLN